MKKGLKHYLTRCYDRTYGFIGGVVTVISAIITFLFVKSLIDPDKYREYVQNIKKF